jgi:diguanylate cyclase (GGDEF)-like protein
MTMENYGDGMETPLMNRAGIMGILKVEFSRARRYNIPFSAVLIQIDRYEYLRDLYGLEIARSISDSVIKMINDNTRLSDFLGKIGERFLLIMPHTDAKGALITSDRIRKKLLSLDFDVSGKLIKVTLSIGIADNAEEESIFYDSIYKRSESALKHIISQGGDGVEIFNPVQE